MTITRENIQKLRKTLSIDQLCQYSDHNPLMAKVLDLAEAALEQPADEDPCGACDGTGLDVPEYCVICNGSGLVPVEQPAEGVECETCMDARYYLSVHGEKAYKRPCPDCSPTPPEGELSRKELIRWHAVSIRGEVPHVHVLRRIYVLTVELLDERDLQRDRITALEAQNGRLKTEHEGLLHSTIERLREVTAERNALEAQLTEAHETIAKLEDRIKEEFG